MKQEAEYRLGWLLLVLVVFAGIGLRWPWPADEPRFALIAQEMVNTGQWLIPHRVGELYPDKPPIFMWAIAVLLWLKVPLKVAFLLPSALAGLGTAWLTVDLARRLHGPKVATWCLWLLAFTVQFSLQARTAQIDMLLVFWVTLGGYGIARHLLLGPAWGWYCLGFAAAGFGVITKGVGIIALFMLLPLLWHRTLRQNMGHRGWLGPLCLLAAIASWGLPMLWYAAHSHNPEAMAYRDNILFNQTANRYVHSLGHRQPFWYYLLEVAPLFWLPLSLLAPFLVKPWWRDRAKPALLLPLVMVLAILLFFSLSPGKRGVYITPALPWLALAIAPYLEDLARRTWPGRLMVGVAWALPVLLLIAAFVPKVKAQLPAGGLVFPLATAGAMLLALVLTRKQPPWRRWGLALAAFWAGFGLLGGPVLDGLRTPRDMMADVASRIGPQGLLALLDYKEQLALFADRPVVQFGFHSPMDAQRAAARDWVRQGPNYAVMGPKRNLQSCFALTEAQFIGRKHSADWYLVDAGQLVDGCEAGVTPAPLYQGPNYGLAGH
ncbi:ArnT family glycosyltransferase [Gallaecimonas xiamenensis]|uniref:Glycosyl transferase family protein n=1 Tax=Gallaecimonas xiamenensis 3-C-1 TaxID=745411 RepID=K2KET6_9GAMM|nr:glycosyltransferase family 39 protein [Gallaecimonas xiamenensis]EKE75865.1 glycosyl transferase family protein [Gallaecimonas xiamenensis 3-C-1]